ncbi:MAG: YifB family Mg chelatase-like AAA ATPase [Lentihominibacter sp.]|jgi:magnesium chelatase family protein
MLTKVKTATLSGVEGSPVVVETDLHRGLPGFYVVGLADTTIKESCRRIKPAIMNSGYFFPNERVTVNLVPADTPKEGSHFDLPIALGVVMLGREAVEPEDTAFLGEVSLDGKINPVRGMLPLVISLRQAGIRNIVVPEENAEEAAILEDINILPVGTLREAAEYAFGERELSIHIRKKSKHDRGGEVMDFAQVIGQESVKRAITIGAAGNHGMLMIGSPGCGKTMMAKRIPTILPELTYDEKIDITGIYSVAGLLSEAYPIVEKRPFRSPHHTISKIGLTGGGSRPKPGELSLAHSGVLFLDELGEFDAGVIDAMRQPVEEGFIRISRYLGEVIFPSKVMVVIAANPCKCGNLWDERKICTCSGKQLASHRRKLTGPFTDRIDMHIRVSPVNKENLTMIGENMKGESSAQMREKVIRAKTFQENRYKGMRFNCNGELDESGIRKFCTLDEESRKMMISAYERMNLTMRAYNKILKLSRTIADIECAEEIRMVHVAEALQYRAGTIDGDYQG